MYIATITDQIRNDIYGIIRCEHCNSETKLTGGYDDDYWHNHVLPARKCTSCGLSRNDAVVQP